MFFKTYGLLWQNARNLKYIKGFNSKMARKLADSKLKTKEFLKSRGVPVPKTLAILKNHDQVTLERVMELDPPFVVKPNNWFGWKWIIVVDEVDASGNFVANTGDIYSPEQMKIHLLNVLDGFFSLSWSRDRALIEKKIVITNEVQVLGTFWLPDVRIIVFNMVPIMAMLRIPTKESDWKANIHWWACAAGIDIWTGKLTYITQHSKIVKSVPWVGDVRGLVLPDWDKMLEMSVRVQKETNIWYLGCDIVMDHKEGPLLLEINIRPWIAIQIANMARLKDRLERVEGIYINSVEKGVRLWRDLFSWDIEEKIRNLSWKKVLWSKEYISIIHNKKTHTYLTEIRSGRPTSIIDEDFVKNVLKIDKKDIEKSSLFLDIEMMGEKKRIKFTIKDLGSVNMILWMNSLKWFLIDPFKYKKWELPIAEDKEYNKSTNIAVKKNYELQLKKIDKKLIWIDKKLLILKNITPTNSLDQKKKFIESKWEHSIVFTYNDVSIPLKDYKKEIEWLEIPEIPLSWIYKRKKEETLNKIKYLQAFESNDWKWQTKYSKKIFGNITEENKLFCEEALINKPEIKEEDEFLNVDQVRDYVKKFNHIYGINIILKVANKTARFVMSWDTLFFREGSSVGKKEMRSIVAHEIEGHYLRKLNWKKMDYSIFWHGTWWYLEIDEWIAVYNQNRFLNTFDRKYYWILNWYHLVDFALNHSYSQLVEEMMDMTSYRLDETFKKILRLKRWMRDVSEEWIFMKDVVYLNWLKKVEDFVHNGGDLKELYLWKIAIQDLEELKQSYFMKLKFNDTKIPFFL